MSGVAQSRGKRERGLTCGRNWAHLTNPEEGGGREVRPGRRFSSPLFFVVSLGFDLSIVVAASQEGP